MSKSHVPVKLGDMLELEIIGVSHTGAGIGRYDGFTIFVPYAIIGEILSCEVIELKRSYAVAKLIEVIKKSDKRCQPACQDFFVCGGSHLQHLTYPNQLEVKQKIVLDILERIGKLNDVKVNQTMGMDEPWGYRNKAVYQVAEVNGNIKMGFYEEDSHKVVSSNECLLLHQQIRKTAGKIEELLNKHKISIYNRKKQKGILKNVVIRKSWAYNKIMVVFVTVRTECPNLQSVVKELLTDADIVSIVQNINDKRGHIIFGDTNKLLAGEGVIKDKLFDLDFLISPTSFYQVNSFQTEVLYRKVKEFAHLMGNEKVLDVYCGIGTISLYLAKWSKKVYGLEVLKAAVKDAETNAKLNGINNVEFMAGLAEEQLPKLFEEDIKPEVIVVDPPRKGVDKRALQAIMDMKPQKVVYVSCDPASLARDLKILDGAGYRAVEVQPVDMFPQTYHVECVALITRK